jgi:23S rRNA pseudouridine1911/1915/1917 synthase
MTVGNLSYIVDESESGLRLDVFLSDRMPEVSRHYVQKLISEGEVFTDGQIRSKSYKVNVGEFISVTMPTPKPLTVNAENIPVDIIYEDDDLLVIDKAKGMVVHPAPGNERGTLVNALLYHCGGRLSSINGVLRPGIVHRLDKDTSGLLLVAKNDATHRRLASDLANRLIKREYRAVVYNNIRLDEGTLNLPIGRDPGNRLRNAVVQRGGREAITHFKVLERYGEYCYICLKLGTGRTHQIRVHMAYIKHPVLGDPLYGPKNNNFGLDTQVLHAGLLGFKHPSSEMYKEFISPLPDEFENVLKSLRKRSTF